MNSGFWSGREIGVALTEAVSVSHAPRGRRTKQGARSSGLRNRPDVGRMSLIRADLAGAAAADDDDDPTAALAAGRREHFITAPDGGPAVLSRELGDFLLELAIAMHKHAIYPAGHPLLDGAVDTVVRTLLELLAEHAALSIGVARRQLVIEGIATDPDHPVLKELAHRFHRHHLGAIKFERGVERGELADFLATLAVDVGRNGVAIGLDPDSLPTRWKRVHAFALTYDRLELLDSEKTDTVEGQIAAGRAAQLWVGLATAALAAEAVHGGEMDDGTPLEPMAVAKAIDEHGQERAYDQVIVGYMLQIADELAGAQLLASGAGQGSGRLFSLESMALQARMSKMLGALKPETLARLLHMGGDVAQRRKFLLEATKGMSAEAVVFLVQAAAATEQQTVSHSMVRLLTKLAKHALSGSTVHRAIADRSVRDTVARILSDWTLADPNPVHYRAVLETASRSATPSIGEAVPGLAPDCEPERVVQMALEIGAVGAALWRAVERLERDGRAGFVLDLVDDAPDQEAAAAVVHRMATHDGLRRLLAAEKLDFATAERIVERVGVEAIPAILAAAASVTDARSREHVYDLVAALGADAPPLVAKRLAELDGSADGAAMQRDLIALLGRLVPSGALPDGVDLRGFLTAPAAQVRREAIKLMLRAGGAVRDEALAAAIGDDDGRIAYLGLTAACERCPRHVAARIRARLDRGELDHSLRALGVRAAATARTADTLAWLISRVLKSSLLFRRMSLLPATPETLEAVTAIVTGWRNDPAAARVLALATKSRDPRYRAAAREPANAATGAA